MPLDLDAILARVRAPGKQTSAPKGGGLDLGAVISQVRSARAGTGFAGLPDPTQMMKKKAAREELAALVRPLVPSDWGFDVSPGVVFPSETLRTRPRYKTPTYHREGDRLTYVDIGELTEWMRHRREGRLPHDFVGLIQHGMVRDAATGAPITARKALVKETHTYVGNQFGQPGEYTITRWEPKSSFWSARPWFARFTRHEDRAEGSDYDGLHARMGWIGPTFGSVLEAVVRDLLQPMQDGTPSREIVPVGPSFKEKRP